MSISQRNLATSLLAGGGVLAFLSQITQVALPLGERSAPVILMFCGALIYMLGVVTSRNESISTRLESLLSKPGKWLGVDTWQVISIIIASLFAILAHFAAGDFQKMFSPLAAWMAWLAGMGACLAGCWKPNDLDLRLKWKPFSIALGLTLLALPLRAIATNSIPIILNGDEASAGIYGIAILEGKVNNIFSVGWYSFPGLYFLIPAASISLLGNTAAALRIPSAMAGALTVGGLYLTGSAMFGKRTGLIAALALAGFHFHIHFSRIGLNNIWDGLFFVSTVGAAWYAWEKENRTAYILAGLGLGFSQYFYPSSRVLLVVVFGGILVSGLFNFSQFKRSIANILMMAWVMIIVFLPLAWYYIKYPQQYLAPLDRVSILGPWLNHEMQSTGLPAWQILLEQMVVGIQAFTFIPLQAWYRPEVALLRPFYAGFFILGLVYMISKPKDSRSIMLLIWLLLYIPLGALSESTPAAQRYVAAAPVCMLILAYGISETGSLAERLWQRPKRMVSAVVVGVAILLAMDDINFYFNKYTPHTVLEFGRNDGVTAQGIANELMEKPEGTQAFFLSNPAMGYYSIPSIPYLAPQVEGFEVPKPWGSPENPIPTSDHLIFIFHPSNTTDMQAVQDAYPGGTLRKKLGVDGQPLYWFYEYKAAP
jgi:hypothetical protein